MSRIYYRGGMSPFETFSPGYILTHNVIGTNVGNFLYLNGVLRSLMIDDNTVIQANYYNTNYYKPEYVNENFDCFVIPLADAFRENFVNELNELTSFVKKLKIPCYVIGVGLKESYEPDFFQPKPQDEAVKKFVTAVLEKSNCIGVRGELTGKYLETLGFAEGRDFMVIGCPSMYMKGKRLHIQNPKLDVNSKVCFNSNVAASVPTRKFIKLKMKEFEKTKLEADKQIEDKVNELKEKASEKFNQIKESAKEKFNAMKETMGNIMGAAKETISEKLNKIKGAYESHGGGFQGVVAATMEGIKGYYSAGFTFIDKLTGGKLSSVVNTVRDKMSAARDTISNVLNSIREKFQTIFDGAADIVRRGIDRIKSFFNFRWSLPKIKLPHFSITGKFSLKPPRVPHFSVSWYKLGGVFDSTTLFPFGGRIGGLGEDGAEAIVPLEKNTKWLDRLASMLAEKQGGSRPIVLQVDGRTFAEISVESINQLTRQRGSLPLKLV